MAFAAVLIAQNRRGLLLGGDQRGGLRLNHRQRVTLGTVLAFGAILAVAAAPSFSSLIANQRVRGASLDLTSALLLARSEAVKRNATVTLAATGAAWTAGWAVTAGAETVRSFEGGEASSNETEEA